MTKNSLDGFEVFHRPAPPGHGEPLITIQARGNLGLNAAAFEALGEPKGALLMFSRARNAFALKAADLEMPEAYPVQQQGGARSWTVSSRAFFKEYGVPIGESRKYRAELVGDALVVNLSQTPLPATSTRGAKGNRG